MNSFVLDEQLIDEVQNHAVIYNRQKYFLNHGTPASKDEAWNNIAIKLRTDVESCKKRWKYLRERYVQQRKQQTDTPTYEHLSRPYLEKMTFLDEHIQPRKSYRYKYASNSSNNTPFGEFVDSSRSNGSINSALYTNYHDNLNVKPEPEQSLHNFSVGSDQQSHPDFRLNSQHLQAAQNMQEPNQQQNNVEFRDRDRRTNIPSSSSSLKSPLSSPPVPESNENGARVKRPRVEIPQDTIDDDGDSSNNDERQTRNSATPRYLHRRNSGYPNNMLYSLNQQFPGNGQVRCTEQLFGELVTSELFKMSKDKRRVAQKRILEVLFFDD